MGDPTYSSWVGGHQRSVYYVNELGALERPDTIDLNLWNSPGPEFKVDQKREIGKDLDCPGVPPKSSWMNLGTYVR